MDYKEFSAKIKSKYPQYKDLDDRELAEKVIAKYPEYKNQVTIENLSPNIKKGIDITPSSLYKKAISYPAAGLRSIARDEDFHTALGKTRAAYEDFKPLHGTADFLFDTGVYSRLPMLKGVGKAGKAKAFIGNALIQGGVPGAIEGLKEDNAIGGGVTGAEIATGVQALPIVGKVAKPIVQLLPKTSNLLARSVGRIQPETLQRAIQPDSKALDLTRDQAQNLLMDTTERIQQDYQSLLNKAGQDVNYAALRLPEDKGVWASSLKDSLDDIYAGYSTSGIKELNPAHNVAGDIYEDIINQIDAGSNIKDVGKVNAKNLNDIMGNIKNYNINWDNSNAKTRQEILKQIYGDYSRRLGNLSPELRKANKAYSKLAQFDDNEGVRRILNPPKKGDIDSASTALRNYNSTVTKGNTNRNIQDLENILVQNGKQPFLKDIDDVNAAMDLLNARATGDSWLANLTTQLSRPALKTIREFNRRGGPEIVQYFAEKVSPEVRRILTPALIQGIFED